MDRAVLDAYAAGGPVLRAAVAGLAREELTARPGPGEWSIQEVAVHLADSDAISIDRMKRIVTEDDPPLLYADEAAYVARLHPHEQDPADVLTLFETGRRLWVQTLRLLPGEAFARPGRHNRRGRVTLGGMVADYIDHLDHHLGFIAAKRARIGRPLPEAVGATVVAPAATDTDLTVARELFLEYAGSLDFDLCFQGFEGELAGLPGAYAPPSGALLLGFADGSPAGCIALRPLSGETAELKRLYVRQAYRGRGLGRRLVADALRRATIAGYTNVRLDTVPSMADAARLYRSFGFREIPPYCPNPIPGAIYMEIGLPQQT